MKVQGWTFDVSLITLRTFNPQRRTLNIERMELLDVESSELDVRRFTDTEETEWRNRSEFVNGRAQVVEFLRRKWMRELDYRLKKDLWAFTANRIAVRFEYEFHDASGQWFRAYGNENWEFAANGLMWRRFASINDLAIAEAERKFRWDRIPSAD